MNYQTYWDISTYFGTIGLFFMLFLLFIRLLPMISIFEMREMVSEHNHHAAEKSGAALHAPTVEAPK